VFFSKLSQRPKEKGLVRFYMHFLALIGFVIGLFVAVCFSLNLKSVFWPGQQTIFIVLAAVWAVLTFYDMVFKDMCDAYALTISAELIKMALKIIGLAIILFLFWKGQLNLSSYFGYHFFILFATCALLIFLMQGNGYSLFNGLIREKDQFESYYKEFSKVCLPLFFFLTLALVGQIFDRWFLQKFSGSVNQGYYSFAFQVGNLCLLFTSAFMPLVLREQSIHFGNMDFEKLRNIFSRSLGVLAALTAFICCFLAVESQTIIKIFAGDAYSAAFVPMVLMCLFPIHQTYGQLNGNFFFATDRVYLYRNIGIIFTILGVIFTFFLLGPHKYGGLNLGANGLSLKMMLLQMISVNVQLWFNAKYLKYSFKAFY
jgi:O-antigen/teichoic acid export membrane protein